MVGTRSPESGKNVQVRAGATTHGLSKTREFRVWVAMRSRCMSPQDPAYPDYGGRGIKVCERWDEFEVFLSDMGYRPSDKHSIDRYPDNDGNYEPGNCRWATVRQQSRNRRTSTHITANGTTKTLVEWSEATGLKRSTIQRRIKKLGWPVDQALFTPVRTQGENT